jgi:hypothetical protein
MKLNAVVTTGIPSTKVSMSVCASMEVVHVTILCLILAHNRAVFAFQLEQSNVSKCGAFEHGP